MKQTGPACIEALSGAEEASSSERAESNEGGVRLSGGLDRWGMKCNSVALAVEYDGTEPVRADFMKVLNDLTPIGWDCFDGLFKTTLGVHVDKWADL